MGQIIGESMTLSSPNIDHGYVQVFHGLNIIWDTSQPASQLLDFFDGSSSFAVDAFLFGDHEDHIYWMVNDG